MRLKDQLGRRADLKTSANNSNEKQTRIENHDIEEEEEECSLFDPNII